MVNDNAMPTAEALQTLGRMVEGSRLSQMIYVAAALSIADLLADGPKTSDELARATGTHAPSLYRVLRGLASAGVLTEREGSGFALTPVGAGLRSDVSGSWRAPAILFNEEPYRAWGDVLHTVTTGETAFNHVFGAGYFDFVAQHPRAATAFNEAMTSRAAVRTAAVLAAYDFSPFRTVVDVGGGQGRMLAAILTAHPELRGILFDRPAVIAGAPELVAAAGVADRCDLASGSFFEAVPSGGDAYVLSAVLLDWDDASSTAILQTCRRAMTPAAKLLLVESVLPPTNVSAGGPFVHPAYSLDLHMMVVLGGRGRTEAEFRQLLRAAGFDLTRVVPTPAGVAVIEGIPA